VIAPDVQTALEALGLAARDRSPAKRGAVTGSVGKTSVTQAVRAALALAGPAHASVKSYNNHIGVPLTLARMPRETERAVFEVGMNHAGEITPLTRMVRPHAALVTTVGPVHVENFPGGEIDVARAKAEIFAGLEPGGVAVLNADNAWYDLLRGEAERVGARVVSFGSGEGCDAQLLSAHPGEGRGPVSALAVTESVSTSAQGSGSWAPAFAGVSGGLRVEALVRGQPIVLNLRQSGHHWGPNSLAVLLLAEALDVPLATTVAALEAFEPLDGRGAERTVSLPGGAFTLVDESYNANPLSMTAAIRSFGARRAAGRRIVAPDRHAGTRAPTRPASTRLSRRTSRRPASTSCSRPVRTWRVYLTRFPRLAAALTRTRRRRSRPAWPQKRGRGT
jgi:UDP-N-acetylmuramoyl-tripeptide--D-alanyl-D-alanine ligase